MITIKTKLLFSLLILSLLFGGCTTNIDAVKLNKGEAISMVIVTDLHYLDQSLFDSGSAFEKYSANGDGRMLRYNNDIIDAFVDRMIETKPDILIISGDLTHNGEKISHTALAKKLARIEKEAGTRVYVIPGNHDIKNAWARAFVGDQQIKTKSISWTDFAKIYAAFGYDEATMRDPVSLSYLVQPSDDLWLLMLDSNHYSKSKLDWEPSSNGKIQTETLDWIRRMAERAKASGARILTVMHHNLISHNELFTGYTLDNSYDVKTLFHELGLNLVLSGHLHIQDIKKDRFSADPLYDIATESLQMYPFQYGTLRYDPHTGFDYETKQLDIEDWAYKQGHTDVNLLHFSEYAKTNFYQVSYLKASSRLEKLDLYTQTQIDAMASTMALLNLYYFSGRSDEIRDEILSSQGYIEWSKATEPEFTQDYIFLMTRKSLFDNNRIHID